MLLQLSLCIVTIIHLASSQPTCDPDAIENDDSYCDNRPSDLVMSQLAKVNSQLVTAVSQLQEENLQLIKANSQLQNSVSKLMRNVSQLHRDIAELNDVNRQQNEKECPADFTYNASVNFCYAVVTRNMEWLLAGLQCRSLHKDAHLLVINDAAKQSTVADMLDSVNETTLSGCNSDSVQGTYFWTAGQRIDPSRQSAFIWRVTSTNPCSETLSTMDYTHWHHGQPDYFNQRESCVNLCRSHSHAWNDFPCHLETCFVCEIDM